MQFHEALLGIVAFIVPLFIGITIAKRNGQSMGGFSKGLALVLCASFALTFVAWMIMRVYIGRTGDSLGILFNLGISKEWWIGSMVIAAGAFSISTAARRS